MSNMNSKIIDDVTTDIIDIKQGSDEFLIEEEFTKKMINSKFSNIPLRIKLGLDPTSPDIHIGHTIVFNKLRQLQNLGHNVIFLIGDFTSMIGDPSGRNSTRPSLTKEEIEKNANTYYEQASKLIDPSKTEIRYNSEWYKNLGASGIIELTSKYTIARILERDDFTKRFKNKLPISLHELIYPIIQGYDSVALKSDLEIGGTDQKFNLLVGRDLQKEFGQEPQCIITMPLLLGLDGIEKMSKSKNNYIGISELPDSMFGKIMSISDDLMWKYFDMLSSISSDEILKLKNQVLNGLNPKNAKIQLAHEIVCKFHSKILADRALENFENRFKYGILPNDISEIHVGKAPINIIKILKASGLTVSHTEANRNIEQGGVKIDGNKISDKSIILFKGEYIIQVGKRKIKKIILD
ncbi:Tyrosine--tRNA ligase [Candidatus Kinetoplastibacterium sorsogonicusi]|uniref:Tyrosine--tRNA ligase n=1 Tax=Candidatus Kinetoplastidibacterium kentomonadis TaxID=1576550 RepID=A0A3S7JAH7_9PROT|nr:tyrosine--tRNA ligase [Candidatus Kinetoplastibacterium sorsogonicusi]AWD32685.1 Tyrosine--tRNA ligase [Candidatus Kinetoplastibacterium sorsogonicusi]